MKLSLLFVFVAAGLASCGPISPEAAARLCADRARAALGPTGTLEVGGGNKGTHAGVSVGITSDFLLGRNPQQVYENCVYERSGQGPIKPLVL